MGPPGHCQHNVQMSVKHSQYPGMRAQQGLPAWDPHKGSWMGSNPLLPVGKISIVVGYECLFPSASQGRKILPYRLSGGTSEMQKNTASACSTMT